MKTHFLTLQCRDGFINMSINTDSPIDHLSMLIHPLVIKETQIQPSEVEANIKDHSVIFNPF